MLLMLVVERRSGLMYNFTILSFTLFYRCLQLLYHRLHTSLIPLHAVTTLQFLLFTLFYHAGICSQFYMASVLGLKASAQCQYPCLNSLQTEKAYKGLCFHLYMPFDFMPLNTCFLLIEYFV